MGGFIFFDFRLVVIVFRKFLIDSLIILVCFLLLCFLVLDKRLLIKVLIFMCLFDEDDFFVFRLFFFSLFCDGFDRLSSLELRSVFYIYIF